MEEMIAGRGWVRPAKARKGCSSLNAVGAEEGATPPPVR
jgi:hypothetical protein